MVTATPIFPQSLFNKVTQFTSATSTGTPTQIMSAQIPDGIKVEGIIVSSSDTSDRSVGLYLNAGSTNYAIATIIIPLAAGTATAVPAVNLLSALGGANPLLPLPRDNNGNPYLYLDEFTSLNAQPNANITSGKAINFAIIGETF